MSGQKKCASCGHDPACGFASVTNGDVTRWYCHDDDHSCYGTWAQQPIKDRWDTITVGQP